MSISIFRKTLFNLMILGTTILLGATNICAGTYYVSNNGTSSWANANNIRTPCSVSTAFAFATAGDTVYFRGGIYNVPAKNFGSTYIGYYNPSNSGTGDADSNRIKFMAYPTETPIFNGTAGGSGDAAYYATIFGTNGKNYITFDGFSFRSDNGTKMARLIIYGANSTGITVKNCTFDGGTTTISSTDNFEALRLERATNILIQRCIIKNYWQSSNWPNTSGIKLYWCSNVTVENCEIYNCTAAIYNKSGSDNTTWRYNFIHDCAIGFYAATSSSYHNNGSFYHNIISKCSNTYINI